MIQASHEAVMVDEVLDSLVFKQNGKYVDCTFGAGGHSLEILKKLDKQGSLISIEKDNSAVINLSSEFKDDPRFRLINDTFSNLQNFFQDEEVDGILIDLGISSTQLDDPNRGFSFQSNGPLDMRIDTTKGQTAAEWINTATKKEIEDVLNDIEGVLESAVFGIQDADFGEAIIAAVVPEQGASLNSEALQGPITEKLARFKHPRRYEVVAELPRNAMGKVQKNILRDEFGT